MYIVGCRGDDDKESAAIRACKMRLLNRIQEALLCWTSCLTICSLQTTGTSISVGKTHKGVMIPPEPEVKIGKKTEIVDTAEGGLRYRMPWHEQ